MNQPKHQSKHFLYQCICYQSSNSRLNITITLLYAILLTTLSLKPNVDLGEISHIDKVAHLLAYSAFTFFTWRLSYSHKQFIAYTLCVIFYGVLIEVIQSYTGRMFSLWDMVANATGAALMFIALRPLSFPIKV